MSELFVKLRKLNKSKLANIDPKVLADFSALISNKIINSDVFWQSKNIACYIPFEYEVDIWPIIKRVWQENKNCYLPLIMSKKDRRLLEFIKFSPNEQLSVGKYKIMEPEYSREKVILPQDLDLVITPLIGFNSQNFRLGRGKGYYDSTFSFKKSNSKIKPHLIGVGYRSQELNYTHNDWDIPMDEIVTET